jgi:FKBP-type peptidyl-prolyl cis-trans isomerase
MSRCLRVALALALLLTTGSRADQEEDPQDNAFDPLDATENQMSVYAMGLYQARRLRMLAFTDQELAIFREGLRDGWLRDPEIPLDRTWPNLLVFERGRYLAAAETEKREGRKLLEFAAAEPGAIRTDSGLIFTMLDEGKGPHPGPDSKVKVHYHGTIRDGTVFDSTFESDIPLEVDLSRSIRCWTEGIQRMRAKGRAKLVCPPKLGYGDRPYSRLIPPQAVLIFELELVEIL